MSTGEISGLHGHTLAGECRPDPFADHPFDPCWCVVEREKVRYDRYSGHRLAHCRDCDRPREGHHTLAAWLDDSSDPNISKEDDLG